MVHIYNHPEVNKIRVIEGTYYGSFKGHVLSTPKWLCIYTYIYIYIYLLFMYIYIYAYTCHVWMTIEMCLMSI